MIPLSLSASITNEISPFCKYLTPPCTSLVLLDDVPFAKSFFSNKTVLNPLFAASIAIPKPEDPPPMIAISQS